MPRQKQDRKVIIGITGSFGSGKSTVAGFFRQAGAKVIDADRLAHQAIIKGKPCYKRIVAVFGKGVLSSSGTIDRRKLRKLAFAGKKNIEKLNRIIHPEVIRQIKRSVAQAKERLVVLDVPLLIESGLHKITDVIVVVKAGTKEQVRRVRNKLSLSESEVFKRLKFQMSLRKKIRLADFVIDNRGLLAETKKQVKKVLTYLRGARSFRKINNTR